jgi:Zn-dependent peptidase ImmA (M78 family)
LKHHGLEWHRRPFTGLAGALVLFGAEYYVVTNSREGWARQRFTAAHELKHYLTDRRTARVFMCRRSMDRGIGRAANVPARELLMPAETVKWLCGQESRAPAEIGKALGVSARAAGIRMAELGLGKERVWWE